MPLDIGDLDSEIDADGTPGLPITTHFYRKSAVREFSSNPLDEKSSSIGNPALEPLKSNLSERLNRRTHSSEVLVPYVTESDEMRLHGTYLESAQRRMPYVVVDDPPLSFSNIMRFGV
jgi:hypothetical protein